MRNCSKCGQQMTGLHNCPADRANRKSTPAQGLDILFFMEKRLPHLLDIAEELLTWCIEEDKKGIYRGYLKKYRKEFEALTEKDD